MRKYVGLSFLFLACSSRAPVNPPPRVQPKPDNVGQAPGPRVDINEVSSFRGKCESEQNNNNSVCEPPFEFSVNITGTPSCYWRSTGLFRLDARGASQHGYNEQISLEVFGFVPNQPTQTLRIVPAENQPANLTVTEALGQNGCKNAGTEGLKYPAASSSCTQPCEVTLTDSAPGSAGARPFDITFRCPKLCIDRTAYECTSASGGELTWTTRQTCEPY